MQMQKRRLPLHASEDITRSTSPLLASGNLSSIAIIGITTTIALPRPLRSLLHLLRCKCDFLLTDDTSLSDAALGLISEILRKVTEGTIPTVGICILVLGLRG